MSKLSTIEEIFFSKIATHPDRGPERWSDIIVHTPHHKLTKQHVFDYYSHPKIREAILNQIKNKPSIIIQAFSPEQQILKRWEKGAPINITKDSGEVEDPSDYQYWIERRGVEFHPTIGPRTSLVHVDLDPKEGYPWDKTQEMTYRVSQLLHKHPNIMRTDLRFSGGKGFYVFGELRHEMDTNEAKNMVHEIIRPLTHDKSVTLGLAGPGQIRLDTSTLKNTGSLRGLYSLNKETGLVSVPLEEEHLFSFLPEHATMYAVLGRNPPKATPIRT